MGLHFVPFVAGIALGALTTWVAKDEKTRKSLQEGATATGDKIKSGLQKAKAEFSKKPSGKPPVKRTAKAKRSTKVTSAKTKAKTAEPVKKVESESAE